MQGVRGLSGCTLVERGFYPISSQRPQRYLLALDEIPQLLFEHTRTKIYLEDDNSERACTQLLRCWGAPGISVVGLAEH